MINVIPDSGLPSFEESLEAHQIELTRGRTEILQINVGRLCDLTCRHCHLKAGPGRSEVMSQETMQAVIEYAHRVSFQMIDITGGAPELFPDLPYLLKKLAPATNRLMLRSNLTALSEGSQQPLVDLCRDLKVTIVASLPAVTPHQTDGLRGAGVWEKSLVMLRRLNELGYGREGSRLELDLVTNPAGAFLPPGQSEAERRFRRTLTDRLGIDFNQLFLFANAPLGRFRTWLDSSGNYDDYMITLFKAFNPCSTEGLMCRTLVSVAWDGTLYDCDFNQAADLPMTGRRVRIEEMAGPPPAGTPITTGEHCYACTAGSGFT